MFLFSHHPSSSPFFPSLPASPHNFFLPLLSDLSGKFESRPGLPCRPSVWAHTYSMSTATVQHPPPSTPCQWTLHSYMPPSMEVPVKLFPKSSPGSSPQGALDGTVSLPANGGKKGVKRPPPPFMFRSGLGTELDQMYSNSSRPHFPQKGETFTEKNTKWFQDVRQLLFVKFEKKNTPSVRLFPVAFLDFSAWPVWGGVLYLHEWKEKLQSLPWCLILHVLKSLKRNPISVSTCCLFPAEK